MRARGTELISHVLEGNSVPAMGAPRSALACLGFARLLYKSAGESSCPSSQESSVLFSGCGPVAHLVLGIPPGEGKSRLFLCCVTSAPTWKLNVATARSAGSAGNV